MWNLFIADLKLLVRNRQLLFWSLMFPLIFTVIFGFFFGKGTVGAGTVALVNKSQTELATGIVTTMEKQSDVFKIANVDSEDEARDRLDKSKANVAIIIPEGFGAATPDSPKEVTVISDPANAQAANVVQGFLSQYLTATNFRMQNVQPIFGVKQETTAEGKFNYFDFVLVGLIGMALMNSSIQGLSVSMAKYREDQILKRITTTPLPTWKFIGAEVLSRLILNFVQVGLIILIGTQFFDGHINGSLPIVFALSLLGAVLFQMIGFAIASMVKTTQAAEGAATAVSIPMMFLAGVFFPIDQLPKWLFSVVQYLPLAPLLRMLRVAALESASPLINPLNMVIVLGWIVAMLAVSINRFRLTEE